MFTLKTMSEKNEDLKRKTITKLKNDIKSFSELLTQIADFEQKFQTHIDDLNKVEEQQSIAEVVSDLKNNLAKINIASSLIKISMTKLSKDSGIQIYKTNSNATNKEKTNDAPGIECPAEEEILDKILENNFENISESIPTEPISPESEMPEKENTNDILKADIKTEQKIIEKPKQGTIRLVPLQNLLSKQVLAKKLSPLQCTISDSDDEKKDSSKKVQQKPQQIFELSDSDEETLVDRRKKTTVVLDKPRIKFTPKRNTGDILKENKNNIDTNTKGSKQNSTQAEKEHTNTLSACSSNDIIASISDNEKESEPPACSSASITKKTKQIKYNLEYLKQNLDVFQKKCVVRIKRIPLSELTKLDNLERETNRTNKNSANSRLKNTNTKTKTMASSSDSDVEAIESIASDSSSSSEAEIVPVRKKRIFKGKVSSSSESDSTRLKKAEASAASRKKRRIAKNSSSDSNDDDDDDKKQRKKIRKVINEKNLDDVTKRATKEEEERKKRIEERQKMYNQIYVKPENVEVAELILDFDEETKKPLLKVDDGLMKKLKPHQVNGVKFMWDACFETVKDCREKPGSGCILAHCMGLGKTMQIVTLSHTLIVNQDLTNVERVLIISPLSTLNNWAREFHYWMSFAKDKNVEIYDLSKYKDKNTRVFKLDEWFTEGGVCIVGYDMYRIMSNEKAKGLRKKQKESLQKSLVNPGPDVVVCDEGHLLKNEKTSLSQAVTKMRTKRRIVLTGTPLQNNLKEYYCMIQFIKPNLLGTYKEYLNRFVNPIMNGQYTDSTDRDIRLMKHRSHILHKMLEACIQRRDYSVLAPYLPPKHEYVVFVTMSDIQKKLYEHYMTKQRDVIAELGTNPGKGAKLFQDFQNLRRIWTHPMNLRVNSDTVIRKKLAQYDSEESMKDFVVEDSEESSTSDTDSSSVVETEIVDTKPAVRTRNSRAQREPSDNENECFESKNEDPSEWWTQFVENVDLNNIHNSPKLVLLMTLLQRCEEIGDKLLVFSQSLQSLDVIEHFLSLIDRKTRGEEIEANVGDFKGYWKPNVNYFRLDGSRTVENRENMCKNFNNVENLNSRLFLISTRAGGLGINLVAANRVVIFDVSWNPSHDTQSIFRVYRFGQVKPCYIYRLIALGTMEQKVYERQVAKQATAKRVIDEQQISRHYNQSDLQELYTYELEPTTVRETPILPKDRLFAELLSNHEKLVFKYHEHDSLLENEDSENLTEEERKAAWDEYEAEKTRPPQPAMQYGSYDRQAFLSHYGNPSGSVTSNKIFGFRSDILLRLLNMKGSQDHPELTPQQVVGLVPEYLQRLYLQMNNGDPTLYKELLELHKSLEAPGGMYMNPLLFANQTTAPVPVMHPYGMQMGPYAHMLPGTSTLNCNEVYEVD